MYPVDLENNERSCEYSAIVVPTSKDIVTQPRKWSQVLPRTVWRFSTDNNALERTRRLTSSMGSYMCKNGGGYKRYPDIKKSEHVMVFI